MAVCKKCDVLIDSTGNFCPLCRSKIEGTKNPTYPIIKTGITGKFVRKLTLSIVIIISLIVLLLNYTLTPNVKWCTFVIAGLVSMYLVFSGIMKGHKRILSMMFYLCFLIVSITVFWDYLVGFRGWSINYVLPSIFISYGLFLIILRFVSYFAFKENSTYIYLNVLLEFVPLILYYRGVVTFKPLALICAILGIINFIILFIFDSSNIKDYIEKMLHV